MRCFPRGLLPQAHPTSTPPAPTCALLHRRPDPAQPATSTQPQPSLSERASSREALPAAPPTVPPVAALAVDGSAGACSSLAHTDQPLKTGAPSESLPPACWEAEEPRPALDMETGNDITLAAEATAALRCVLCGATCCPRYDAGSLLCAAVCDPSGGAAVWLQLLLEPTAARQVLTWTRPKMWREGADAHRWSCKGASERLTLQPCCPHRRRSCEKRARRHA